MALNNVMVSVENETFCDDTVHTQKQVVIGGICVPVLICIGLITNIVNVTIFGHHKMRKSPINGYLICLSVFDILTLCCASFMIPMQIFAELIKSPVLHNIASMGTLVAYPVGQVMHASSIYLTVAASGFRFIAICFPFESQQICTMSTVKRSVLTICICSVLYNCFRFFELQTHLCSSDYYKTHVLELGMTELRKTDLYVIGYLGWSHTVALLIVPFTLLIIMNWRVMSEVRKSRKFHLYTRCSRVPIDANDRLSAAKERNTTIMLIGIVVVFIICNLPALVSNVMEIIINANNIESPQLLSMFGTIVSMSNLLVLANMGFNFFIYYGFSDRYRTLFRQMLCKQKSVNHAVSPNPV